MKGLRREKRRDEATALAALRRPGWEDWRSTPSPRWTPRSSRPSPTRPPSCGAQSAAIEGRDGPDMREALADLRERSADRACRRPNDVRSDGWPRGAGRRRPGPVAKPVGTTASTQRRNAGRHRDGAEPHRRRPDGDAEREPPSPRRCRRLGQARAARLGRARRRHDGDARDGRALAGERRPCGGEPSVGHPRCARCGRRTGAAQRSVLPGIAALPAGGSRHGGP